MIDNMEHGHQILSVIADCLSMARSNLTEIKFSLSFLNIVFDVLFQCFLFLEKFAFDF